MLDGAFRANLQSLGVTEQVSVYLAANWWGLFAVGGVLLIAGTFLVGNVVWVLTAKHGVPGKSVGGGSGWLITELEDGEVVLFETHALVRVNRLSNGAGLLSVTNRRLIFTPMRVVAPTQMQPRAASTRLADVRSCRLERQLLVGLGHTAFPVPRNVVVVDTPDGERRYWTERSHAEKVVSLVSGAEVVPSGP